MGELLQFLPKARTPDSDFPAIPTRASFYKRSTKPTDDLVMDHVDTAPAEYSAPDHDCA